ncbi:MAG: DUF3368 domain-containing protein [Acidobacteriota bacterium]
MPDEVIADTSPLQYLHQTGCLELLPQLYGSILVPEAVVAELDVGRQRGVVLPDPDRLPWIRTVAAPHRDVLSLAVDLGPGEREVLALAAGRAGSLALLDDRLARHFARHLNVAFTGTLGVLLKAKTVGHLNAVRPILDRLQALGFWLAPATRQAALRLAGED